MDAYRQITVISTSITCVMSLSSILQITNCVIELVAIGVINYSFRPFAIHIKPCKAPSSILNIVNTNNPITVIFISGYSTNSNFCTGIRSNFASKYSCLWIIIQKIG